MTQYNNNFEREFDWNDTITQDSEFIVLEPGDYWFMVKGYERARHTPNPHNPGKLPACNKAILDIEITTNDGKTKTIKHNLFLHSTTEGMLSAFFGAIGHKKHGEQLNMNWQLVPGSVGVCTVRKGLSNRGNEYNDIGRMIYADKVDLTKVLNQRPSGAVAQPVYQQPVPQQPIAPQPTQPLPPAYPHQQANGFQPGKF